MNFKIKKCLVILLLTINFHILTIALPAIDLNGIEDYETTTSQARQNTAGDLHSLFSEVKKDLEDASSVIVEDDNKNPMPALNLSNLGLNFNSTWLKELSDSNLIQFLLLS